MNKSQSNDEPMDPSDTEGEDSSKSEILHYIGLELERANKLNATKLRSDISFRFFSVIIGVLVLILLWAVFLYVVGSIFVSDFDLEPPFKLVVFAAPITSITVITLTMLIGGSRIAKENSKENYVDVILQLFNNLKLRS